MFAWFSRRKSDLRTVIEDYLAPLPTNAPIRNVVASPAVEQHLDEFDRADRAAIKRQASYRRASRLALWAGFIGAMVPALWILPVREMLPRWSPDALNIVKLLSVILTSLAIMWLSFRQSGARWLRERGIAEESRAKVFQAILLAGATSKELLPQALDCFKSAHLNRQLAFFENRGGQFDEAARKTGRYRLVGRMLWTISAVLALVAIVNLAAALKFEIPLLSAVSHWLLVLEADRWHLGLDAMAASILAFASERSSMDRDTRTASSYKEAADDLSKVKQAGLQTAEEAARAGNGDVVTKFCNEVQSILDAEQRAWRHM